MAKKDKKPKGSYTIDNRPKGVSKREWIQARTAEGRNPYARFFADPVPERKRREALAKIAAQKTQTPATPTIQQQDRQNGFTVDTPQGGMSVAPLTTQFENIAKNQGNYLEIPQQQQSIDPAIERRRKMEQERRENEAQAIAERQQIENSFGGRVAKLFGKLPEPAKLVNESEEYKKYREQKESESGSYLSKVKSNPKAEYDKFTKAAQKFIGYTNMDEAVAPFENDRQKEIKTELDLLNRASQEVMQGDSNIFGFGLSGENKKKMDEMNRRRMELNEEYRNISSDELKNAEEKASSERAFAIATSLSSGGSNMYKEIAKSQSPNFIKSFLRGKVDDVALEKITPNLVKTSDPNTVKTIIETAQGIAPKQGVISRFFAKKPEQPKTTPQPKTQAIKEIVEGKPKSNPLIQEARKYKSAEEFVANRINGKNLGVYDENLGSKAIQTGKDTIRYTIKENDGEIKLFKILADKKGTGEGKKFMEAIKEYSDSTGKKITIVKPTNDSFWNKFDWLENPKNMTGEPNKYYLEYNPKSSGVNINKDIRTLTIKTADGGNEYVAQIGDNVKDRVGRTTGFKSQKTSPNFKTQGEADRWIKENIKGLGEKTPAKSTDIWNKANKVLENKESKMDLKKLTFLEADGGGIEDAVAITEDSRKSMTKGPIKVALDTDGKYMVLDGRTRAVEAYKRGENNIPVEILSKEEALKKWGKMLNGLEDYLQDTPKAKSAKATAFPSQTSKPLESKTQTLKTGIANAIKKEEAVIKQQKLATDLSGGKKELKKGLTQWIDDSYAAKARAEKEALDFKIPENPSNLDYHESGIKYPGREKVEAKFKELFKRAQDADIFVDEKANYVPHVYKQTPEQMQKLIVDGMRKRGVSQEIISDYLAGKELPAEVSKALKINPSFSKTRVFDTYADAREWGLTPKYTEIRQLVGHYTEQLETAIANKKLITSLAQNKVLSSNPGRNGIRVNIPGINEEYFAEPKLAAKLNDYFRNEAALNAQQKFFKYGANFSKGLQNIVLAGGIPKTNVNFFTLGIGVKNLTAGVGNVMKGDIPRAITNFKTIPNLIRSNFIGPTRKYAEEFISQGFAEKAAKQGIDITHIMGNPMENNRGFVKFFSNTGLKDIIPEGYSRVLNEKTFKGFIPMQRMTMFRDTYKTAIKQGLDDVAASKLAGDTVKNFEGIFSSTKGKSTQDMINTTFFAPQFREGLINTYWNTLKSISPHTWTDKSYAQNRALALGMFATAAGYEMLNRKLTGHSMKDNPSGKQTELMIPGKEGKVYYVPWMPSQSAFMRNLIETGLALGKGDTQTAIQKGGSNLSMGVKLVTDVMGNRDYFGNEIYDPQEPIDEQAKDVAAYVGLNANHPYVKGIVEQLKVKYAEKNAFYPKYLELSKLADQGKSEELKAELDKLGKAEKQAYYDLKGMKLKSPEQILSESIELPIRFTTEGKIKSQEYYRNIENIAKDVKSLETDEEKTNKIQEYVMNVPKEERYNLLKNLEKEGIYTGGVTTSDKVFNARPVYDEINKLFDEGKSAEAYAKINRLTGEMKEGFNEIKSQKKPDWYSKKEVEDNPMRETFDNVKNLMLDGKDDEAQKVVNELSDADYKKFVSLRSAWYATNTTTLRAKLKDDPDDAYDFYSTLPKAEKERLSKLIEDDEYDMLLEAKNRKQ